MCGIVGFTSDKPELEKLKNLLALYLIEVQTKKILK